MVRLIDGLEISALDALDIANQNQKEYQTKKNDLISALSKSKNELNDIFQAEKLVATNLSKLREIELKLISRLDKQSSVVPETLIKYALSCGGEIKSSVEDSFHNEEIMDGLKHLILDATPVIKQLELTRKSLIEARTNGASDAKIEKLQTELRYHSEAKLKVQELLLVNHNF